MGQKQGLDNLLRTAQILTDKSVRFVLVGDGNDKARLVAIKRSLNLQNVSFAGVQEASRFEAMLRAADILLVNQRRDVVEMALPSKLTSYFAAGRPIIAAVDPNSNAAHEIRAAGAGVVVSPEDPAALLMAIVDLRGKPSTASQMGTRGEAYCARYLRPEVALKDYEEFLEKMRDDRVEAAIA
jgi:glycosyltransferase involved in cell wall biosynthesis